MKMATIEVSFGRALKIWWSFLWRATVLMTPVMAVAVILSMALLPIPKPGQPPGMLQPGQFPGMVGKAFFLW